MDAISLAEQVFRAHLNEGPFQSGVDRGRWRLISINWPLAVIAVSAAARTNAPSEYYFRFELTDYPATPPTARPWHETNEIPLEFSRWPCGQTDQDRISRAFNPNWKSGISLYLPCDRCALEGHDPWRAQHAEMLWNPQGNITHYLKIIYDLLHSEHYTGLRGP